jgi:flagellar biosynthetic protein FlhB
MAEEWSGQDRTEEPSDKRREDFRNRGQVAVSRELSSVGVLLFVSLALVASWPYVVREAGDFSRGVVARGALHPETLLADPTRLLFDCVLAVVRMSAPVLAAGLLAALLLGLAQAGLHWSWQSLQFDWNRLDPFQGLRQRLFSAHAAAEWVKSMAKVGIVGWIAWKLARQLAPSLPELALRDLAGASSWTGLLLWKLLGWSLLAMLVLAVADYAFVRWQLMRRMRMTRQELREEHKEQEGDPQLRARIRRLMQEVSRNRLVKEVTAATVVVSNPTHFAVALRYELGQKGPPRVVAKGVDSRAIRIQGIARSAGVPRIENRPLARALYAQCRVGQEVPAGLFEAVAEVLAFVYRVRGIAAGGRATAGPRPGTDGGRGAAARMARPPAPPAP